MRSILRFLPILALLPLGCADADEPSIDEATAGVKPARDTRTEIALPGDSAYPEGIAAARDGTLYVGSIGTGAIFRVPPGATEAAVFVPPRAAFGVYGVALDERRGTLWACTYDDTLAPAQPAYLSAYDLASGELEASFVMPGESGFCNDLVVNDEGTVYATDSFANTIVRLLPGADALETWASSPAFDAEPWSITLNGIAIAGPRELYVVKSDTGELFSVPIASDGSAGDPQVIPVDPPLSLPDGLEIADDVSLVVVENTGAVARIELTGNHGHRSTLADGLSEPTTAALHRGSAWVVEGQLSHLFGAPGGPELPFRVVRVKLPE
jgi:sugar lactone lactonase YvrE